MPFSQRWLLDPLRNWRKLQVHAVAMRGGNGRTRGRP